MVSKRAPARTRVAAASSAASRPSSGVEGDGGIFATGAASRPGRMRCSSSITSRADCARARGSFSRQRDTMRSRSDGASSRTLVSEGGVSRRIAELITPSVEPSKGRRPVANS